VILQVRTAQGRWVPAHPRTVAGSYSFSKDSAGHGTARSTRGRVYRHPCGLRASPREVPPRGRAMMQCGRRSAAACSAARFRRRETYRPVTAVTSAISQTGRGDDATVLRALIRDERERRLAGDLGCRRWIRRRAQFRSHIMMLPRSPMACHSGRPTSPVDSIAMRLAMAVLARLTRLFRVPRAQPQICAASS